MENAYKNNTEYSPGKGLSVIYILIPAVDRAHFLSKSLSRRLAGLEVLEGLRMYAAGHGGRLPDKLSYLKKGPAPLNPMDGKSFPYVKEGDVARIYTFDDWQEKESQKYCIHYEITVRQKQRVRLGGGR